MIALLAPFLILAADPAEIVTLPVRRIPQRGHPTQSVFISPGGEPFRAPLDQPYPIAVWFARADANHDGKLTPEEFFADAKAFFDRLDVNHDQVVDGFEIADYESKIVPELQPDLGGFSADAAPPPPAAEPEAAGKNGKKAPTRDEPAFNLLLDPEPVASSDTDLDGKVSLKEAMTAASRRFKRLDLDNDGVLTLQELPQTPAEARKRHR
jgi:hypothetical protein